MINRSQCLTRRQVLAAAACAATHTCLPAVARDDARSAKAQIAITLDLEMSRDYPQRGMAEWDYQKGNLDEDTKQYAVNAARIVKQHGGVIHFFCVGRVLEQPDIEWLKQLAADGHPIGNHTYDHVNVLATEPEQTQFRFRRAPWLVRGMTARQIIEENIRLTQFALKERAGITQQGFRTPGGFRDGLAEREDIQHLLLDAGFRWVSSRYPRHQSGTPGKPPGNAVYADILRAQQHAQPYRYSSGLIEIPMSPISDVTAFRSHRWRLADFLRATESCVRWAVREAAVFDFLAHPSCLVVEDPQFEIIRRICELVSAAGNDAEICDLDRIAERVGNRENH